MRVIEQFPTEKPKFRTDGAEQFLSELPEIPEEFFELAYHDLFKHYIFEEREYDFGINTYECSHCGAVFEDSRNPAVAEYLDILTAKHNSEVFCPFCGVVAEKKIISKAGKMLNLDEFHNILFIVRHSDNRVYGIRGTVSRLYSFDYWKENKIYFTPDTIHIWTPGRTVAFLVSTYYFPTNNNGVYWAERFSEAAKPDVIGKRHGEISVETYVVGTEQLQDTFLRYSTLDCVCEQTANKAILFHYDTAIRWLSAFVKNPAVEFLVKIPNLRQIIYATIAKGKSMPGVFNWRAKSPDKFFRMSKADVKYLLSADTCRHNLVDRLAFRAELIKYYPDITFDEVNKIYTENGITARHILLKLISRVSGMMSLKQIENYIRKQYANYSPKLIERFYFIMGEWRDYLDMAEKLGYDLSQRVVIAPKNLHAAHDTAVDLTNAMKRQEFEQISKKRQKLLDTLYNWTDGEILIRPPVDAAEIVAEGQKLHHCVAGYANRHVEGTTTILFVRRCSEPDVSLYTMELDAKNLWTMKQIRGIHNCDPDAETLQNVEAWLASEGHPEVAHNENDNISIHKERVS